MEALEAIDDVTVTYASDVYTVTFVGDLAKTNVSQMHADVAFDSQGTAVNTIKYTYDAGGRLTKADDTGAAVYNYTVDNLGRRTATQEVIVGLAVIDLDYDYDVNSNRTEMAVGIAGEWAPDDDYINAYTYDNLNRLITLYQDDQSDNAVAAKTVTFVYNALGQFTYINRFENTAASGPTLRSVFTYDGANRFLTIHHRDIDATDTYSTTLSDYDYTYDDMGRIIEIDSSEDGISDLTFDATGQLTDADHAAGRTDESYTYDETGNRTGGDYVVGDNNQTTESTDFEYEYDRNGNRTMRTDTTDDSYEVYTWDHRNRLTKVEFFNSSDTLTKSIDYVYDAFNRMVKRTLDSNGATSGGVSHIYWAGFDGIHATLEFDGGSGADLTHRYLWGPGPDFLLADEQVTSVSSDGKIYWTLGDQVDTIQDIAEWDSTNSEFVVANHRTYDSFGNLESETDSSVDIAFGYTGKWTDPETGYTHHLNRWYDPNIGKWLSEDPSGFNAGDTNLSRYVNNEVITKTDSNGLEFGFGVVGTLVLETEMTSIVIRMEIKTTANKMMSR